MSHRIWGSSKVIVPTIWGTDWDICSVANHVIITLDPSPCYNQEVSIITAETIRKLSDVSRVHGLLFIYNPKLTQCFFSCLWVPILSFSSLSTSCFYSRVYFWLFWPLISCVLVLLYCPNICSYVNCALECPFLIASLSWVDDITFSIFL